MGRYILNRIFRSFLSLIAVMFLVVLLVYSLMDRNQIFAKDQQNLSKFNGHGVTNYKYQKWEEFGYLDRIDFVEEYCAVKYPGGTSNEDYNNCAYIPDPLDYDADKEFYADITEFKEYYRSKGYGIFHTEAQSKNEAFLFAYKDYSPFYRLWNFFKNLLVFDGKNYLDESIDIERYVKVQKDPLNGMPAVMCSGCKNKYLLYFDNKFPFIHQNWVSLNLGRSYPYPDEGGDILEYWTSSQGDPDLEKIQYPRDIVENTGKYVESADDLHNCTYSPTLAPIDEERFVDNYVICEQNQKDPSRFGYSFIIGIFATVFTYLLGVPIGIMMARHKGKIIDKIGIVYIVFVMAVPSLAYIYLFQSFGYKVLKLPTDFAMQSTVSSKWLLFVLPIISLILPSIAGTMKWIRRYMIDQMNSDYVKFARAKGLSEGEIFNKHILKNAMIPIVHGIPGSILGCLTGSLVTEKVYNVPGIGREFTNAINNSNNSVILAMTLFYSILSITSLILGDVLMAVVDPRISFSTSGGRK